MRKWTDRVGGGRKLVAKNKTGTKPAELDRNETKRNGRLRWASDRDRSYYGKLRKAR